MEKSNLNITPPTVIILDGPTRVKDCTELQQIGSLSWSIAGKPVVRHIIEELQQIGVENCFTLSSGGAKGISQLVRDELHWSNRMRIEILDYELDATAALRLFATLADTSNLLLIEPGLFTECCITTFLSHCSESDAPLFSAENLGQPLGLTLLTRNELVPLKSAKTVELSVTHRALQSKEDFLTTNISVLEGNLKGRVPSLAKNPKSPHWQHNRSFISKKTDLKNIRFVDRGSHIAPGCELEDVIIQKNCVIEKNVRLKNVVLLSGAWIPSNQHLVNSIVSKTGIYEL